MGKKHVFDSVIVGSGLASLVCGAELSLRGHRVAILEREAVA
ncbi:MAG: NAD(P)-binding protein, partial [Pseudomonadota bacterium]